MNNCVFIGNLARDSELRYSQSGTAIASFAIAVNRGYGEKKTTSFFNMTLFGKRAESLNDYLTKGTKVGVICEASQSSWEKDGVKQYKIEFIVNDLELLGGGKGESSISSTVRDAPENFQDDEIPF